MSTYLTPLLQLQRFFLPAVLGLVMWATWRTVWRRDVAVGLALYIGLVIIVDGFLNTAIFLPGLEKGSIRYSELCAAFLLVNRPGAGPWLVSRRIVLLLVGAYFTLLLASALRSEPMVAGIFEFRGIIVPQIVSLLIAMRGFSTPDDYRRFVLHLTAIVMIIAVFNFWDIFFDRWLLHSDTLFTGKYWMTRRQGRFGSVFLNPNMMGAFTVLVFPVTFIWALNEPNRLRRLYAWSGLLALLFCLVETQSRGPLIALGFAVLMLAIGPCGTVSRSRRLGFLAAFVLVFMAFMPGFFEHAVQRFSEVDKEMSTGEARTRETTWVYTKQLIAEHPLAGIGFGEQQFLAAMDGLGFKDKYGEGSLDNPHNSYLQMTVYAGYPALGAFLLAHLLLLWHAGRGSWQNVDPRTTQTIFGLAVGNTAFLAAAYPDMHLFTRDVGPVYWVFCGLLVSLALRTPQGLKQLAVAVAPAPDPRPAKALPPAAVPESSWSDRRGRRRETEDPLRAPGASVNEAEAWKRRGGRLAANSVGERGDWWAASGVRRAGGHRPPVEGTK